MNNSMTLASVTGGGSSSLSIQDLDIGVSKAGMEQYKEQIKSDLLITSKELLQDISEIERTVNAGWQGVSKDKFLSDFKSDVDKICEDLENEHADLQLVLGDLEEIYYKVDASIMGED